MIAVILFCLLFLIEGYFIETSSLPRKNKRAIQIVLFFVQILVIFGFRGINILNDTKAYADSFSALTGAHPFYYIDPDKRFEPGFQIYERIIYLFVSQDPFIFQLITAFIISVLLFGYIKRHAESIALTTFILLSSTFLFFLFSVIRNGLAVLICLYAFDELLKKNYWTYALLVLLAISFHSSAIVFILPFVLQKVDFSKRNVLMAIGLSIGTFIFFAQILSPVISLIMGDSKYVAEMKARESIALAAILNAGVFLLMLLTIYHLTKGVFVKKKQYLKKLHTFIISRLAIAGHDSVVFNSSDLVKWVLLLTFLLTFISIKMLIIDRYAAYFEPILLLYFSNVLSSNKSNSSKYAWIILWVLFLIIRLYYILIMKPEWFNIWPYKFHSF